MFWPFRSRPRRQARQSVNPAARRTRRSHLTLEMLEAREVLSVSVMPFTDPASGAAALRVIENGPNDTVMITDNSTAHTTTVVADGKTQTFNRQFARFDLQLLGQKDTLEFDVSGAYSQRLADVQVHLGKGENHFAFNPGLTAISNKSDVNLNVVGSNGNDFVNLNFGDILESRVNVAASNLGGSKGTASSMAARDSITFGTLRAGIRNSSVDVNFGLGSGTNNLAFNYGSDLGHLAGAGVAADFGPSTMNVNIIGSGRSQDAANVTLFANGEVNTGSTLNFNTQFLAGNNNFKAVIDAANFQIDDDGGEFITGAHLGGAAHFTVHGGSGNDNISFASINQTHTIELSGLFDVNIAAGAGKDNVNVDFGGSGGFTDDDPFELAATNRAFRLRIAGGSGPDTIDVNLSNAATATFGYDVAIQGGSKKNDITFVGVNPGGSPTFGPSGSVFIDGGSGQSEAEVSGNFPVVVVHAKL